MNLREQFEAWLDAYERIDSNVFDAMFDAFQAGHAASNRDDLLAALEDVCKCIECHEAEQRDFSPDDEYDDMMFPKWDRALAAIKKARGEV